MAWFIIALVIAVPVAEIAVFVKVAQAIGGLATVALAVGGGLVGLALVRAQGGRALLRAQALVQRGEMPVAEMFDGLCLALAGGLLILPGFLSDLVAIVLVLPPVRAALKVWLARHFTVVASQGGASGGATQGTATYGAGTVIDGDYTVVEPERQRLERD